MMRELKENDIQDIMRTVGINFNFFWQADVVGLNWYKLIVNDKSLADNILDWLGWNEYIPTNLEILREGEDNYLIREKIENPFDGTFSVSFDKSMPFQETLRLMNREAIRLRGLKDE